MVRKLYRIEKCGQSNSSTGAGFERSLQDAYPEAFRNVFNLRDSEGCLEGYLVIRDIDDIAVILTDRFASQLEMIGDLPKIEKLKPVLEERTGYQLQE